jgi:hypothetical protein
MFSFLQRHQRWLTWVVTLICLLAFWGMALDTAVQKTLTADEPVHLTRGIALWQGLDFRLQQEHTPLSHWFIGLLTRTETLPDLTSLAGWNEGERLITAGSLLDSDASRLNLPRLVWLGRVPIIWLGVLLGALMARWARTFAPQKRTSQYIAQITAVVLFAFSPNLIAHTAVATTDFTATIGYFLALFTLYWYAQKTTRTRWLLAGLGLGLGLASKMTGLLLLPITLLLLYIVAWPPRHEPQRQAFINFVRRPLLLWLPLLPLAGLVVWGVYRFDIGPLFVPQLGQTIVVPVPDYLGSLLRVTNHIDEGHKSFLMGEISTSGWYHYFGVAFGIKTAVSVLLLLFPAIFQGWRRFWAQSWLWLPALLLFGVASYTRLNIGYRHILPILPLLMVWGAAGVSFWLTELKAEASTSPSSSWRTWARIAAAGWLVLLGVHVLSGLRQHPHHLAYFNLLVGGSENGYLYLLDSNLDWGQDLHTAVDYLEEQNFEQVFIAPFGFHRGNYVKLNQPRLLGDDGLSVPGFSPANPTAGHYLISSNYVQGMLGEPDLFDWFRRQEPVEKLGYTLFAYDVVASATGNWIAHCADPAPRLTPDEAEQIVNTADVRHVYFDCQQNWVWPAGMAGEAGWYILPDNGDWWPETHFPANLQLVYEHRPTTFAPGYAVYYWTGQTTWEELFAEEEVAQIGNTAVLRGYQQVGQTWRTMWEVTNQTNLPLSILAHLYVEQDDVIPADVADGLGYSAEQWQTGDLFVQTHRFSREHPNLLTGLYDYTTGERLMVNDGSDTAVWLYNQPTDNNTIRR